MNKILSWKPQSNSETARKMKKPLHLQGLQVSWRRRRDSNPRTRGYRINGFRDRRIQPLCHPSAWGVGLVPLICETRRSALLFLAERWGFEPQIRFWRIHDFQSCTFGQLGHLSACLQPALHSRFLSCAHAAVKYFTLSNTNSQEKNTHCFCHFSQLAAEHRTASSSSGRSAYPLSLHQRTTFPL